MKRRFTFGAPKIVFTFDCFCKIYAMFYFSSSYYIYHVAFIGHYNHGGYGGYGHGNEIFHDFNINLIGKFWQFSHISRFIVVSYSTGGGNHGHGGYGGYGQGHGGK